jgi:CheY-like chemotaxis protein
LKEDWKINLLPTTKKMNIKLKNFVLFLIVLLHSFLSLAAHQSNPLSISQEEYGKDKIEVLIQKAKSNLNTSSDQVKTNALKALELALANHDTSYMSLSYCYLGAAYIMEKEYDTAYVLLNTAEAYALMVKDRVPLIRVYNNIATIFDENRNEAKAFEYYSKAVSIIEEDQIDDLYLPLLSLSTYYCKRGDWIKADELLNKVIENSKINSDDFYLLIAQLNRIETRLFAGVIDLNEAEKAINQAAIIIENKGYDKLNNRVIEVRLLHSIETKQYKKAIVLIKDLPETQIKELKKKRDYLDRIVKFHDELLQEKTMYFLYRELNRLNHLILEKYELDHTANNNAQFELANQQMIIDQILSDKSTEEHRYAQLRVYFNIAIASVVLLILTLIIVFFTYNKKSNTELVQHIQVQPAIHPSPKSELCDSFDYLPVFKLDSQFFYEKANSKFYEISGRPNVEFLRGANDYDLPWKDHYLDLLAYYNEVKINKQYLLVKEDLFNCNSELFLIPLIKSKKFTGILGFVLIKEQQKNKEDKNKSIEIGEPGNMTDQKQTKVLIVDDEEDNLILLKRFLKNTAFELTTASNGVEAIDQANKTEFDIVLMDLEMPVKNGYDTIKDLKEINKSARVFALTAHARNEIKRDEIAFFDEIISKPVNKQQLLNKLLGEKI